MVHFGGDLLVVVLKFTDGFELFDVSVDLHFICLFKLVSKKLFKKLGTYRLSLTLFRILSFCSVIRVSILLPSPCIFESNFCRLVLKESILSCISFNLFKYSAENRDRIWLDCVEISSLKCVSAFLRYSTSILSIFFKD